MASHTSKFEAMPLMEKDEDWEDPDDLVLGPLNSVLENMKYNSRTISRSELWKAILFASALSFVAGVTVPYIFYSLIFHHCAPDVPRTKTFASVSESVFLEIKEDGIKSWQRKLDELNSSMLPLYIKEEWQKQGLDKVTVVSHNITFSLPNKKKISKLLVIRKDVQAEEFHRPDLAVNGDSSYIKPLCCASAIETIKPIEGDPLFANFGRYEDFLKLSRMDIDINGKIVIMKYGMVPTASKVLLAQKFGAVGVILFPAKSSGIQNIKMSNISCHILLPDETMHFCPATDDQFLFQKIDFSTIPVYPIANEDAEKILRNLTGGNEPVDWRNVESLLYNVGPGFKENYRKIRLEIYTEDVNQLVYSSIGKLNGKLETDRSIVLGSLSRSKNFTGFSVLLEISKIFSKSLKYGIRPRRNILFCAWGSGDYLGTHSINEWIKDHQEHLGAEAVAYIDIDTSVSSDHYQFVGTPMLVKEISEAIQKVLDKKEHDANLMIADLSNNSSLNDQIKSSFQVTNVGGYMPFYNIFGIPSLHVQYNCKSVTPHQCIVDCSSNEMSTEDFHNTVTLAQIWTKIIHSLSHSLILNLDIAGLIVHLNHSIKDLEGRYGKLLDENSVSLSNFSDNIEEFTAAAKNFQKIIKDADSKNFYIIRNINDKLMRIGRSFVGTTFSSKRFGRRNLLYGSSNIIACNMAAFPRITDLLLELNINNDAEHVQLRKDLQEQIAIISSHIKSATEILQSDI